VSSVVEKASASGGDVLWTFDIGDGGAEEDILRQAFMYDYPYSGWRSSPTVVGGIVYQTSLDGNLYAVDAESGDELWRFGAEGGIVSSPVVKGGTVYAGSLDGNLYAVNTADGTEIWRHGTGRTVSSPTATQNVVYTASQTGYLHALDTSDGTRLWRYELESPYPSRDDRHGVFHSSPTLKDSTVYVGCSLFPDLDVPGEAPNDGGALLAIDARDGTERWRYETGIPVISSPTVSNGAAYVGVDFANVDIVAVNIKNGSVRWKMRTQDRRWFPSSPAVGEDSVYAVSLNSRLYSLSISDGSERWSHSLGSKSVSSPTVAEGMVFVGSNRGIHAVDIEDGTEVWSREAGRVSSSPTVVDGVVYFASDDGTLYAMDAGVAGSSRDSRVELGTLGHHNAWAENDVSLDVERNPNRNGTSDTTDEVNGDGNGTLNTSDKSEDMSLSPAVPLLGLLSAGYLYDKRRKD